MATHIVIKSGKSVPKNPVVIEGFPSKGFVSTIAAKYIIDQLGMEDIGYIESDKMKNVAVIHNSVPMRPVRIYAKDDLLVILSELMLPQKHIGEFSHALIEWFKEIIPSKIVLLAGVPCKETEKPHEIFGLSNNADISKMLDEMNVQKVEEGMVTGVSSDLLLYCIDHEVPAISLMTETKNFPDPLASASALNILGRVLSLNLDTKKLIDEGQKIEKAYNDLSAQAQNSKDHFAQMEEHCPSMYG